MMYVGENMSNISRIKSVSHKFRLFFTFWLVCTPILYILYWVFFNDLPVLARSGGLPPTIVMPRLFVRVSGLSPIIVSQDLSMKFRFTAFIVSLIPMSIDIAGLLTLVKLFKLYEKGKIFTIDNVKCFRRLGYILIIWAFASVLYDMIISGVLTHTQIKPLLFGMSLRSADLTTLIIGGIVLVISWVMNEGCKLEEEHALTI
jgi:hypothetical protein